MEDELIKKAMTAMGWSLECEIPMANEENRRELKEIERLMEKRTELLEIKQQTKERLEKLQQHKKNAVTAINHNLKLLSAYQTQMRNEASLTKIVEREHSKIKQDIKEMSKESNMCKEYVDYVAKELCRRQSRIDVMTNRLKWAKTVIIEWKQAMNDSYKGALLLERYFKEDELKGRTEDHRRQQLQVTIDKTRAELIDLNDEQRSLEQCLEGIANMYRSAHVERRQMVETWKIAVNQMLQRERLIKESEEELLELKTTARKVKSELKEHDNKLNDIIEKNREIESDIEEMNKASAEIKEKMEVFRHMIIVKSHEVELLQRDLQNLANLVENQRLENRQQEKSRQAKMEEYKNVHKVLLEVQNRLKVIQAKNFTAHHRVQMLEEMTQAEERVMSDINKEIDRLNSLIFRSRENAYKLHEEEKLLEMQVSGKGVTIQAITKNKQIQEKQLDRQMEMHYNMSFKCLLIERRILRLQGGLVDVEKDAKCQQYFFELEDKMESAQKRLATTEQENKKLDDNMRQITMLYNSDYVKLGEMHFKIKESQTYCEGGLSRLQAEKRQNQVLIVELSLLKMRADRFEIEIEKCALTSYNLEKHHEQLIHTMKDRMVEIKAQKDLLLVKQRHLDEERGTLRADIGERNKHIDAVKARFELTSHLLGTNHDGTLVTATQLKVEVAQEKQMLLDEGDALNVKVLKAEQDIKALENTVMLMNHSNDQYRKTLRSDKELEESNAELKSLHTNYCKSLNHLKALRNKLLVIEHDTDEATKQKDQLQKLLIVESTKKAESEEALAKLQKDIIDQKDKIQRADREKKNALKALNDQQWGEEILQSYEKELNLRELEYRNMKALNQISDLADTDVGLGPKIIDVLTEKSIKLPHKLARQQSYTSWRSEISEMSLYSLRDGSSVSEYSQITVKSPVLSVVSFEFKPDDK